MIHVYFDLNAENGYHIFCDLFLCGELLAPSPNSKLEDHPLLAVRNCLFHIFVAILHILRPSPPSAKFLKSVSVFWRAGPRSRDKQIYQSEHVPAATNTNATFEVFLETGCFCMVHVEILQQRHKVSRQEVLYGSLAEERRHGGWLKWRRVSCKKVDSPAVKRRLCVIFGKCNSVETVTDWGHISVCVCVSW
jgi:hypothetical protein